MEGQQKQTTNDFVLGDMLYSKNGCDAELSQELNDTTETLQWKKRFEESEAKVLKIMEAKEVLELKINFVRVLMQGHLKDFPLTNETQGLFKNVLRVLNPDPDESTSKGHGAQQKLTPDTGNALSSVKTGSSLGVSNTRVQNYLDIPVTPVKRRQVSVGSEVSQKKARRNELPATSIPKMTLRSQTRKDSQKSSTTKTPSKIGEFGTGDTGDIPHQIETPQAPSSQTSRLQSTTNTNMGKHLFPFVAQQVSCTPEDIITIGTNPQTQTPAQCETLHLVTNGNEDLNVYRSLASIQIAVECFAKSLLKNIYFNEDTKAIIMKLCVKLKCDPVALTLAACYINEDLLVLVDLLNYILENYFTKIDIEGDDVKVREVVEKPFYLTWRVTCEKIRETPEIGGKALKVMEIISFLAAENIATKFILDLCNLMENEDYSKIGESIFQLLKRFSIINSSSGETISVHPLIQEATRNDLEEQGKLTEVLSRIQSCANKMIQKNSVTSQEIIHFKSICEHVTKRPDLIKEADAFPSFISDELITLGKYREAYAFSCRVLPVVGSSLGDNHRCTLKIIYWIGVAQFLLAEYSKSLELLAAVHVKQTELFGEKDDDCFDTANRIGVVLRRLGKYDKALKWNLNTLEIRERVFGKEHPGTLALKTNIALVLKGQGNYKEAMELYQQVLEVRMRVSGKEHPSTLATKQNVACVRYCQGNFEEALKIFQEVLQLRVLEVDHPDTLTTKHWIADTYECLNRNNEAAELYKEVLEKRQEILGPAHPQTLTTKHNLALVRFNQRDYINALNIFQEVLEVQERVLKDNHPDTLTTKCWIADTYRCLRRNEKATELYTEVLEKREKILGHEHPHTIKTRKLLKICSQDEMKK